MRAELEKLFQIALIEQKDPALRAELEKIFLGTDGYQMAQELTEETEKGSPEDEEKKATDLFHQIKDMSIPQKIKLALFGNQIARSILIRDTNRQVPLFVLQNPRIGDSEISDLAKNPNLNEQVLRHIGSDTSWMKNYATKLALVSNPKVPVDTSVRWLKFLKDNDLRRLAKSKNVPQVISTHCRKLVDQRSLQRE